MYLHGNYFQFCLPLLNDNYLFSLHEKQPCPDKNLFKYALNKQDGLAGWFDKIYINCTSSKTYLTHGFLLKKKYHYFSEHFLNGTIYMHPYGIISNAIHWLVSTNIIIYDCSLFFLFLFKPAPCQITVLLNSTLSKLHGKSTIQYIYCIHLFKITDRFPVASAQTPFLIKHGGMEDRSSGADNGIPNWRKSR